MEKFKFQIPYYKEINEFFESIPSDFRTLDPNLYCLRMLGNEGPADNIEPPLFIHRLKIAGSAFV